MPICRYVDPNGQPAYALYRDGKICPLEALGVEPLDQSGLFAHGPDWVQSLRSPGEGQWQAAPDHLLPPVAAPEKIFCIGLNYRDHAIETGAEIPTEPVVFSKFPSTLIGHGDTIRLPKVSSEVDYEAELVVVVGREGKHIAADQAMQHVFGYTCGHDVSARDWQKGRPGGQWLLGKTFDTFAPVGPALATTAEVQDPSNLQVRMRLNGDLVQDSTTAQLIFGIPQLIAHLSQIVTLRPGDLIFTGTPPGVGAARKPPLFLKPGDRCEVEIESLGTLRNVCESE